MSKRLKILLGFTFVGIVVVMLGLNENEVRADANPEPCVCSTPTIGKSIIGSPNYNKGKREDPGLGVISHCHCGKLECVTLFVPRQEGVQLSCHK